jgi:hypothetical protein
MVGRDDSSYEFLSFDINKELEVIDTKQINEKINGIQCGNINGNYN